MEMRTSGKDEVQKLESDLGKIEIWNPRRNCRRKISEVEMKIPRPKESKNCRDLKHGFGKLPKWKGYISLTSGIRESFWIE